MAVQQDHSCSAPELPLHKPSLDRALGITLFSLPARSMAGLGQAEEPGKGLSLATPLENSPGMWPWKGHLAIWQLQNGLVITNSFAMDKPPPPSLLATVFSLAGPQKLFLWQKGIQFSPTVVDYHISKSGQNSCLKRWTAWDRKGVSVVQCFPTLIHSSWLLTRLAITAPLELFSVLVPVPNPWIIDMMEHNGSLRAPYIFSCQTEYREMLSSRNSLTVVLLLCVHWAFMIFHNRKVQNTLLQIFLIATAKLPSIMKQNDFIFVSFLS